MNIPPERAKGIHGLTPGRIQGLDFREIANA
jgi:hypothetical protein